MGDGGTVAVPLWVLAVLIVLYVVSGALALWIYQREHLIALSLRERLGAMRVKLEDAHAVLDRFSRMESPSTVLSLAQVAQQLIDEEQRMLSPEERAMPLHIRRQLLQERMRDAQLGSYYDAVTEAYTRAGVQPPSSWLRAHEQSAYIPPPAPGATPGFADGFTDGFGKHAHPTRQHQPQ
jgi:hypothetical protein